MAVYRNRSTTSVPASLSISYLIGSPPTGTSTMTLTSRGGSTPMEMASIRMSRSAACLIEPWKRKHAAPGAKPCPFRAFGSVAPGEGDLVERLGPELLRGARDHAAAECAIKLGRGVVVGERPNHHALKSALHQIAPCGGEQSPADPEPLKLRPQVKLVDLAFELQAARAVAAVVGVASDFVAEHQHADAAAFPNRAVPPMRTAAIDQLLQFGAWNDALVG